MFLEAARRAAEAGFAVTRSSVPVPMATKFGPAETADILLSADGSEHACVAWRIIGEDAQLRLAGWQCGAAGKAIDRLTLACALDRLDLVGAGDDPALKAYFSRAERNRLPQCGSRNGPGPAGVGAAAPEPAVQPGSIRRSTRAPTCARNREAKRRHNWDPSRWTGVVHRKIAPSRHRNAVRARIPCFAKATALGLIAAALPYLATAADAQTRRRVNDITVTQRSYLNAGTVVKPGTGYQLNYVYVGQGLSTPVDPNINSRFGGETLPWAVRLPNCCGTTVGFWRLLTRWSAPACAGFPFARARLAWPALPFELPRSRAKPC